MVVPDVTIISERERPDGLTFQARLDAGGTARTVELRLHWADYNHWSPDGADPPERVALAALRFACSVISMDELPASFDASTLRRRHPDADARIMAGVRSGPWRGGAQSDFGLEDLE